MKPHECWSDYSPAKRLPPSQSCSHPTGFSRRLRRNYRRCRIRASAGRCSTSVSILMRNARSKRWRSMLDYRAACWKIYSASNSRRRRLRNYAFSGLSELANFCAKPTTASIRLWAGSATPAEVGFQLTSAGKWASHQFATGSVNTQLRDLLT